MGKVEELLNKLFSVLNVGETPTAGDEEVPSDVPEEETAKQEESKVAPKDPVERVNDKEGLPPARAGMIRMMVVTDMRVVRDQESGLNAAVIKMTKAENSPFCWSGSENTMPKYAEGFDPEAFEECREKAAELQKLCVSNCQVRRRS